MSIEFLAELAWKSAFLIACVLILLGLLRERSAAEKSLIADAGLLSLLLLPLSIIWLPRLALPFPDLVGSAVSQIAPSAEAGSPSAAIVLAQPDDLAPFIEWNTISVAVYLFPAIALLAGLLFGLLRLRQLSSRARLLEDSAWLSALNATRKLGGAHDRARLLTSDEISSPISWGVLRPVIMIDTATLGQAAHAEAVLAHEAAHISRFDWLRMIIARLAVALLWFNPLAWALARRSYQLREEAADDAVLGTAVAKLDYADLLLAAVRQADDWKPLIAHGMAESRTTVVNRITHVLDVSKSRRPAAARWAVCTLSLALAANGAVAASEPMLTGGWSAGEGGSGVGTLLLEQRPAETDPQTRGTQESRRQFYRDMAHVRALMRALRDKDPRARQLAAEKLSRIGPEFEFATIPPLSRLLEDSAPAVRAQATITLGGFKSIKNSGSIEKLLLRDPYPNVRLHAAHALGNISDLGSRDTLEAALRDEDPAVRAKAMWALRQLSGDNKKR